MAFDRSEQNWPAEDVLEIDADAVSVGVRDGWRDSPALSFDSQSTALVSGNVVAHKTVDPSRSK